eukprot:6007938-Ditylum_brightwellii.AAC.1
MCCNGVVVYNNLNGNNVHLKLVISETEYAARNGGNPYIASPNYPSVYDTTMGISTSRVHQSQREAQHMQRAEAYLTEQVVEQVIKNQLKETLL